MGNIVLMNVAHNFVKIEVWAMIKDSNILDSILTIDDYIDRKIQGHDDNKISTDLFVGKHTLERWKMKVGVKRYHVNQKRYFIIKRMSDEGYSTKEIACRLKLTDRHCLNIKNQFNQEGFAKNKPKAT